MTSIPKLPWEDREQLKYDRIWMEKGGSYAENSPEVTLLKDRLDGHRSLYGKVLIVGGGSGSGFRWIKENCHQVQDVKVCDISGEVAKYYPAGVFTRCPAHCLLYGYNQFDCVLCVDVIEHIPESAIASSLAEMNRVCRRELGRVIIQARCAASVFEPGLHLTVQPHGWWRAMFAASLGEIEHEYSDSLDVMVVANKRS